MADALGSGLRGPDQYTPVIESTMREQERLGGQLERVYEGEERRLQERRTQTAPVYESIKKELEQPTPQPPQTGDIPQYQPKQISGQDMSGFAMIAMAFAALGTKAMRGDITMAMNAAAGAMKGFNEGALEQSAMEMKQFDEKIKSVIAQNKNLMDRYNAVMESRKYSLQQKTQLLSVIAHAERDEAAIAALKIGKLEHFLQRNQQFQSTIMRLKQSADQAYQAHMDRVSRAYQSHLDRQAALKAREPTQMTPQQMESAGAQAATGMPLSQIASGFGQAAAARREMVRSAAIANIMQQHKMSAAEAGAELARRQLDFAGIKGSVAQLEKMRGATIAAVEQLHFNVGKTTEAIDKLEKVGLGSSDISPVLNAIVRGTQKWTGAPEYAELFFYMSAAGKEAARIQAGGQASIAQLYEGARKEAQEWADAGFTTPKMWKEGVAPAMLAEGNNRIENYDLAIKGQRKGIGAPRGSDAPNVGPYSDPEKERRYQEWKRTQGQ